MKVNFCKVSSPFHGIMVWFFAIFEDGKTYDELHSDDPPVKPSSLHPATASIGLGTVGERRSGRTWNLDLWGEPVMEFAAPFSHVGHQKMIWQFDILLQSWGKATWSLEYFLWLYHDRMAASNTLDSWEPQHEFCWLFLSWMSLSSKIIKDEPKPSCLSKLMHFHPCLWPKVSFGQAAWNWFHGLCRWHESKPRRNCNLEAKTLVYYQYQTQIETVAQFEAFVIVASLKKNTLTILAVPQE